MDCFPQGFIVLWYLGVIYLNHVNLSYVLTKPSIQPSLIHWSQKCIDQAKKLQGTEKKYLNFLKVLKT